MPEGYEAKFAEFIRMCSDLKVGKIEYVLVANPKVLGDSYDELVESLNRIAEAGGKLVIAGRA